MFDDFGFESQAVTDAPPRAKRAVLYLRVSTTRQATKNGEAEGYSIPAQRAACERKAAELGATVAHEFVDAGASAKSADRAALQEMMRYVEAGGIDYVIVHKLDRLARDLSDNVMIRAVIEKAGATLVSVSENIDKTPSGILMHGMFAVLAEHYSRNLGDEAKKGILYKAKSGGTHGVAPLGYFNTLNRIEGREIKGIVVDESRAEHIRWAFHTYATGEYSLATLRDMLEERGLRSRKTAKYTPKPLNLAQVHRMLRSPYYVGKVIHRGVMYEGMHTPIIDMETFAKVQLVMSGRRIAGDRSWKHTHYLKGSLVCNRCGGRMGYGHSRGKGGIYTYFFCLGRHTGRTNCDLPYVPIDDVVAAVERDWGTRVTFSDQVIAEITTLAHKYLEQGQADNIKLAASQQRRLPVLARVCCTGR